MQMTQEKFDRLGDETFNSRMGDFLYIHREANPKWYYYFDMQGNNIMHGGDRTDAIVRIKQASREKLEPRLMAYLKELLGRHGEELHEEGVKLFKAVTIHLPYKILQNQELEVTVHTGSGCYYDQDEIAYEIMAALSGLLTYKVVSPKHFSGFERRDRDDDRSFVQYYDDKHDVEVKFSCTEEDPHVVIAKTCVPGKEMDVFRDAMYERFTEYVKSRTGQDLVKVYGTNKFSSPVNEWGSKEVVEVAIEAGDTIPHMSFSMTVPYRHFLSFARLEFAKHVMDHLYYAFREVEIVA